MEINYVIDTLFAIFAMTLIIFMVPGFAMLEAGLVRTKNVTAVLTTAGPDQYSMYQPILIGAIGGALVVLFVPIFDKLKMDDPVGALSVHLVNGIWGTLAVGIFVSDVSILSQLKGVIIVGAIVFPLSYAIIYIINKFFTLRADDDEQLEGIDSIECGIESYPEFKRTI